MIPEGNPISVAKYIYIYIYIYYIYICFVFFISVAKYPTKGPPEYCRDGTVTHLNYNRLLLFTLLDLCVSSLRRGHANLLCIVPSLTDDPRRESIHTYIYIIYIYIYVYT